MKATPQKDESITRLLEQLRLRLGEDAFDVVDHWKGDLCATGVARPDNHSVLVYISTFGKTVDDYFVSMELPTQPGAEQLGDFPYSPAGEEQVEGFDRLVQIIERHFAYDRTA